METTAAKTNQRAGSWARTALLINLCFACLAGLIIASAGVNLHSDFDDSDQYRQAARNIVAAGDPYITTRPGDSSTPPYPNPPLLAYLLVPTLPLGEVGGRAAWFLLNVTAFAALLALSLRVAAPPGARTYWGLLACAAAFAPPTYLCLLYGQLGIMLALLLVAGFAVAERRPAAAGASLALATAIKLYPGLPALYYLLRGQRRVIWWAVGAGLVLLAIPALFHGLKPYQSYLQTVLFGQFYPYAAEFNVSLMGFWRRLFTESGTRLTPVMHAPELALALTALSSLAVLAVCVRFTAAPGRLGALLSFSLWLCATLLLSPINGYYNLAGLLLPMLVIVRGLVRYPSPTMVAATVIATALICTPPEWYGRWPALGEALLRGWGLVGLVPPLFGLIGYVVILALLARRHCQTQ